MRNRWCLGLILLTGCGQLPTMPDDLPTPQVNSQPFSDPVRPAPTRVSYAPAAKETSDRVLLIHDKLLGPNSRGIPSTTVIGAPDPEIFYVGQNQIYITEGFVRQCQTDGQLAGALAFEMGRIISEREASVSDEVRQPDRLLPIELRTGGGVGNSRDRDPTNYIEMAMFEKQYPKQAKKLARPNPQVVARGILERAGYQSTDLDAALPILQAAERNHILENQFKGAPKQGDWKQPY